MKSETFSSILKLRLLKNFPSKRFRVVCEFFALYLHQRKCSQIRSMYDVENCPIWDRLPLHMTFWGLFRLKHRTGWLDDCLVNSWALYRSVRFGLAKTALPATLMRWSTCHKRIWRICCFAKSPQYSLDIRNAHCFELLCTCQAARTIDMVANGFALNKRDGREQSASITSTNSNAHTKPRKTQR